MRKLSIFIILILVIVLLVSCRNSNSIIEENIQPYEKITLIETENDLKNSQWLKEIKDQLIVSEKIPEMTADRIIKKSVFNTYKFEYVNFKDYYEENEYPYKINMDMLVWQSYEYYAICQINNKKYESASENIKLIFEETPEMWVDGFENLKVVPINKLINLEIGGRASFLEKGKEQIGPFMIVEYINFSCPTFNYAY